MMKWIWLIVGLLFLFLTEMLRVYFIMPFPGSQEDETLQMAYFIQQNLVWLRIIGFAVLAWPFYTLQKSSSKTVSITLWVVLGFYVVVFYMFNFRYLADKIFLEPKSVKFIPASENKKIKGSQLVIGIDVNGSQRAYPVEILGYHHQVRDTLAGRLVMVTYCTVCRTGRVYEPLVDNQPERFRLVGMDHYNAMFEDSRTGSWWRQVSGEAVAGKLLGKRLPEIPSAQMTLDAWAAMYPQTEVMQPDSTFQEAYDELGDYDEGKRKGRLTRRDSLSWKDKSWVVGVQVGLDAAAYDWNDLVRNRILEDQVGNTPVVVAIQNDSASFHVWSRVVDGDTLSFTVAPAETGLVDQSSQSAWNWKGVCVDGPMKGKALQSIQSYQEYWHSWQTFRPSARAYKKQ